MTVVNRGMRKMALTGALVAAATLVAVSADAQLGHPAKGTWIGHWGADKADQQRMVLLIDWSKDKLSSTINPGPDAVKVKDTTIDYDNWTMTLKADLPANGGKAQPWVATGKLENLGSWTNRHYSGTYQYGNQKGDFSFTLQ